MNFHGTVFYQKIPQVKNNPAFAAQPTEKFVDRRIRPTPTMSPDNKKRRKRPRRPDSYFYSWGRKRVLKAKKLKREFEKIRAWIDGYLESHPEYRHPKSVMVMLWTMMRRYGLSIRGMIDELHFRRGSRKAARLRRAPSKSRLHTSGCADCLRRCLMSWPCSPGGMTPTAASLQIRPATGSTGADRWTTPTGGR